MEQAGRIKVIMDTQTFDSGFQKREFVITTAEQYPQDIKFEFFKEKCEILDQFKVGDEVNVHFNIRGNEYNGRYFVNLNSWKMEKASTNAAAEGAPIPAAPPMPVSNDDDDLPF